VSSLPDARQSDLLQASGPAANVENPFISANARKIEECPAEQFAQAPPLPLMVTAQPMAANGIYETSTDVRYTAAFGKQQLNLIRDRPPAMAIQEREQVFARRGCTHY